MAQSQISVKERPTFLLWAILLLGFALRIYRFDFQSLWHDEILTFFTANAPIGRLLTNPYDVNIPPLYYLIVKSVIALGGTDGLLRLPSVLFGSLTILIFYLVVRNCLGERVGLTGAFLLAISPFHIWYSQEARPYVLLILLSLVSLWILQLLLRNPRNTFLRAAFVLTTAATFYCQTLAIAFIGFLALYIFLLRRELDFKYWLVTFVGIGLVIAPAVLRLVFIHPMDAAHSSQAFNPLSIVFVLWAFLTGYSIGPALGELHLVNRTSIIISHLPFIIPLMAFGGAMFLLGTVHLRKKDRNLFYFFVSWVMFPLAFSVLGAIFTVHPFQVRYAILCLPPLLVFLSMGFQAVGNKWLRTGALGVIVLISVISLANYHFKTKYHRENYRAAGEYLAAHSLADDLIIVSATYTLPDLRYYFNNNSVEELQAVGYPFPDDWDGTIEFFEQDSGPPGAGLVNPLNVEADLRKIVGERDRFWLFLSRTYHSDPDGHIRKYCDATFRKLQVKGWSGVDLILYRRT